MPSPMDHILTRNMSEGVPLVLEDVMQVIVTLVVNRTVGVGRNRFVWAGVSKMIGQPGLRYGFRHRRLHRIVIKQAAVVSRDFINMLPPNLCSKRCYFLGNRRQVYQFK